MMPVQFPINDIRTLVEDLGHRCVHVWERDYDLQATEGLDGLLQQSLILIQIDALQDGIEGRLAIGTTQKLNQSAIQTMGLAVKIAARQVQGTTGYFKVAHFKASDF